MKETLTIEVQTIVQIKELIKDLRIEAGVATQTESKESVRNARAAPSASKDAIFAF